MPAFDSTTLMDLTNTLPIHAGDVQCVAVNEEIVVTASEKVCLFPP